MKKHTNFKVKFRILHNNYQTYQIIERSFLQYTWSICVSHWICWALRESTNYQMNSLFFPWMNILLQLVYLKYKQYRQNLKLDIDHRHLKEQIREKNQLGSDDHTCYILGWFPGGTFANSNTFLRRTAIGERKNSKPFHTPFYSFERKHIWVWKNMLRKPNGNGNMGWIKLVGIWALWTS